MIYYNQVERGKAKRKGQRFVHSLASPLQCLQSFFYWDLQRFADVEVVCEARVDGTLEAVLRTGAAQLPNKCAVEVLRWTGACIFYGLVVLLIWGGGGSFPFKSGGIFHIAVTDGFILRVVIAAFLVCLRILWD